MLEFTLKEDEAVHIGNNIYLKILPKSHPKYLKSKVARIGIEASKMIKIYAKKKKIPLHCPEC